MTRPDAKLDHIAGLADRISLIIRQLKIFVRGDELLTAPVSLRNAISEATTIMEDQIQKAGVALSVTYPDGDLYMEGDEILLQQLFVNLVSNALDAVSDADNPQIDIRVRQQDELVLIEVRDNGKGVSDTDLPNLFEPFYTTKKTGRGLGTRAHHCTGNSQPFWRRNVCS